MDFKMKAEEFLTRFGWPILVLIITLTCIGIAYLSHNFNYWVIRGVPGPKPSWFFGNTYARVRGKTSMAEFDQMLYENYGGHKYCGIFEFLKPTLVVGDPELLKHIMIKDFDHFTDRR